MGKYMTRVENQATMYLKTEKENMKKEVAGKISDETNSTVRVNLENQYGKGGEREASGNDAKEGEKKEHPMRFTTNSIGYLSKT